MVGWERPLEIHSRCVGVVVPVLGELTQIQETARQWALGKPKCTVPS